MSRHNSLGDLRKELSIELRNQPGASARYNEEEMDVALARACSVLADYFWMPETDVSNESDMGTFEYQFDYPVRDIYRVAFIGQEDQPLRYSEDFTEQDGLLVFHKRHRTGNQIRVWYERHPFPYPRDLTLQTQVAADATELTVSSGGGLINWPKDGYFKINNEVVHYTDINRETRTLICERGVEDTHNSLQTEGSRLSFVNRSQKHVFFEGVKDLAFAYLNRMRIIDAPVAEVQGNVTVMNDIFAGYRQWIRTHRMRSQRMSTTSIARSKPMKDRRRGP